MNCPMCGKNAVKTVKRFYQYDNGEQFVNWVCDKCSNLHTELLTKEKI